MPTINDFKDMKLWSTSIQLAKLICNATNQGNFAKDFSLKDQIRRAAFSISSNIAEGFERSNNREFIRFLLYAKGSAAEVRSQLYIAKALNYVSPDQFSHLEQQSKTLVNEIGGFIRYLKNYIKSNP